MARGGNAVLAMRFDCNEIGGTASEVAAYGTAVYRRAGRRPGTPTRLNLKRFLQTGRPDRPVLAGTGLRARRQLPTPHRAIHRMPPTPPKSILKSIDCPRGLPQGVVGWERRT